MSFLAGVTTAVPQEGQRIIIAGVEKSGKTTLCCNAPGSLLIPMEAGYASIRTPRLGGMVETWAQVVGLCEELTAGAQSGRIPRGSTNVWDSGTALERIIHNEVIRTDPDALKGKIKEPLTMESCHGAYGKGYAIANQLFAVWQRYQDQLAYYGGINCVVTCHVFASTVKDAAYGEYNSWDLLLHSPKNDKTYGKREMITQWADMVGFLHEPLFVMKAEKGQTLSRGIGANQGRVLAVDRTPGWVAGNRYKLTGTIPIPKPPDNPAEPYKDGWNTLAHAIYANTGIDVFNREV